MRGAPLAVLVALSVLSGTAAADDPTAALSVHRGEGALDCPDAPALAHAVAEGGSRRLLRTGIDASGALRFDVTFSRSATGYAAVLRVEGPRAGVRSLEDPGTSCSGVAEAVALTVSLLLDGEAPLAEPGPPPRAPDDVPATAPHGGDPRTPTTAPPRPGTLAPRVGGGFATGLVRPLAPWLAAGASWTRRHLSVELAAAWVPSQALQVPPGAIDVWFLGGEASACYRPWADAVRVSLCPLGVAGVVHASARGFSTNGASDQTWLGAGARLAVERSILGPLGVRLAVAGVAPLHGQAFRVDGAGTAYTPAPVAGLFDAALVWAIE